MSETNSLELSPIVLFVYNRPNHTKRTLDALAQNILAAESELYIYIDGLKPGATQIEVDKHKKVEKIVRSENRFRNVIVIASPLNKGLANAIIEGVTNILSRYETIIVLEDDMVTSKHFLQFLNNALSIYSSETDVACISGYIYPVSQKLPDTFFIKGADCWGWATWKRAWKIFEPDGKILLERLKQTDHVSDFNFYDSYPYLKMLEDQISGKNNSWAIRWYAAAYLNRQYTLYPGISFLTNIGFDGSGTHSGKTNHWESSYLNEGFSIEKIDITENRYAKECIAEYFKKIQEKSLMLSAKRALSKLLKRFL